MVEPCTLCLELRRNLDVPLGWIGTVFYQKKKGYKELSSIHVSGLRLVSGHNQLSVT